MMNKLLEMVQSSAGRRSLLHHRIERNVTVITHLGDPSGDKEYIVVEDTSEGSAPFPVRRFSALSMDLLAPPLQENE